MLFTVQTPRWDGRVAEFRTLHLSLNAPVIAIDELPVGPARAGIALCVEQAGSLRLEIAVRSLQTGQVIAFAPDKDPAGEDEAARVLEAGFSFAEGMGFLFDDEESTPWDGEDLEASFKNLVGEAPLGRPDVDRVGIGPPVETPAIELVHEVPAQDQRRSEPVCVDVASEAEYRTAGGAVAAAILSKHRLALGGDAQSARGQAISTISPTENDDEPDGVPVHYENQTHTRDTRIRLLSRF